MKDFCMVVKDYNIKRLIGHKNKLFLLTKGEIILVMFDKENTPMLQYLENKGLPQDVEEELKKKLKEVYPNGF